MSQICSSDLLVKNSIQAVVEPLRDGLKSISIVYEALIGGDVDSITGKISNYDYIREQIERAKQSLERSEQEASSAMVIGGAVELSNASEAVKIAEEEKKESEEEVDKYRSKVSDYKSKISQTELEIKQKRDQKEKIRKESQKLKKQRAAVAEFQKKVRRAVHSLSALSGKADVAECQTRRFILQEPLIKVMEEVMEAAGEIGGNKILADEGMRRLLNTMREKQSQADNSSKKKLRRSRKGSSWKKCFCLL
ncbi:uncharacterized protein [Salminus brasiliensis]|uniref:uncharacterized protein n=1 Tax=Salminus brasiliensis TaxID=930266 RepID=UPI003B838C8D